MSERFAPRFAVQVQGLTIESDVTRAVIELVYDNSVDSADMVRLVVDNSDQALTDSPLFDVGKRIEVSLGYDGELQPMMVGEITAVAASFPASGAPTLQVTAYDRSHRLRHNSPARFTFTSMNDSAIAARIAAENGLLPVVDPAPTPARPSVQQTGSDWALLKEMAERNSFLLYVRGDELHFHFPRPQTDMVVLEWQKNLLGFTPRVSTSGLAGIQVVRGFDPDLARTIVAAIPVVALGDDLDSTLERLGSDLVGRLADLGRQVVRDRRPQSYLDASQLALAVLRQMVEGLFEGSGTCVGLPELRAGDQVEIGGLGRRFSGRYRLHKVTHTINASGYQTAFEVSQRHNLDLLDSLRAKLEEPRKPRAQPGVMAAQVVAVGGADKPGQVRLKIPDLSDANLSDWTRVAMPFAGAEGQGGYFPAQVDDTVMVAFEGGDVNRPFVVGSFWNAKNGRQGSGDEVPVGLRSRSGMEVVFKEREGQEELTIAHPEGGTVTMTADGNVSIRAKGNIELSCDGDIVMHADNIKAHVSGTFDVNPPGEAAPT